MIKKCPECGALMKYHKERSGETWICSMCGYEVYKPDERPTPESHMLYEKRN